MGRYCKRLIEVDLPIKRISAHARREKSIRHGHILLIAYMVGASPSAACRAVICASLWPDPADPFCPQKFREEARNFYIYLSWSKENIRLAGMGESGKKINYSNRTKKSVILELKRR